VRLVYPAHRQATQALKAGQTECQVVAAWDATCPEPRPGSQTLGIRNPRGAPPAWCLGSACYSLTHAPIK